VGGGGRSAMGSQIVQKSGLFETGVDRKPRWGVSNFNDFVQHAPCGTASA